MPRGSQLARQWRLLQLLDRPAGVTVDDAATELCCAVRTIWRDLGVLQDAGFPILDERASDGRRGLWKVAEDFKLRLPLKLSLSELAALLMSRELLMPLGTSLLGPSVASAFDKIANVLSRDALALIDRMRETVGVRGFGAKLQLPAAEHVPQIQRALVERRRLRMLYYSIERDEEIRRDVDPYHLTLFDGGLYLIGHCHLRGAPRTFAVERIRRLEILRATFAVPPSFDVEQYLSRAWGIVRGEVVTVKVVFAKSVARYVGERLWHPTQKFRELPDGRLEMTMRVADTLEVRRWILGYGVQAEILEPASLREALRVEAEALALALAPKRRPLASVLPVAPSSAMAVHSRGSGQRRA